MSAAEAPRGVRRLTLVGRSECPLCDEFTAALAAWRVAHPGCELTVVDIDDDAELKRRYAWRIPVLLEDEREVCSGHFDPAALDSGAAAGP